MSARARKAVIAVAAVALAAAAVAGGVFAWRTFARTPADVYPVSNVSGWFGTEQSSLSGTVSAGAAQEVRSGQTLVEQVLVHEGDRVHEGDVLLRYDTESAKLTVLSDQARVQVLEAGIDRDRREISRLQGLRPAESAPTPTIETVDHGELATRAVLDAGAAPDGEGEAGGRFRCTMQTRVTAAFLRELRESEGAVELELFDDEVRYGSWVVDGSQLPRTRIEYEPVPAGDDADDVTADGEDGAADAEPTYFAREVEALDADWTLGENVELGDAGAYLGSGAQRGFGVLVPCYPEPYERYETIEHYPASPSDDDYLYSRAELASMIAELQKGLRDADIDLRQARVTLAQDQAAQQTGEVRATIDGIVTKALAPGEAAPGEAIVAVRGAQAFIVTAYVDETTRHEVRPGEELSVFAYESGTAASATVTEVGDVPAAGQWGGDVNPNTSWYPVTASVDDPEAQLSVGEYCEVTRLAQDGGAVGFYLPNMFIRTDDAGRYVLAAGADGSLERRAVVCGGQMWGEYTNILDGLGEDDLVAFPYGSAAQVGAPTTVRDYPQY